MSEPILNLHYIQTVDDVRADFLEMRRRWGISWVRMGAALMLMWIAFTSMSDGFGWWTVLTLLMAGYLLFTPPPILWLFYYWGIKRYTEREISIDIDDVGLLYRDDGQRHGNRFYWSRLTGVDESERGLELSFDRESFPAVRIPHKAFASESERVEFKAFLEQHRPT